MYRSSWHVNINRRMRCCVDVIEEAGWSVWWTFTRTTSLLSQDYDPVVSLASDCVTISRAISVFIAAWRHSQITCRCCPGRTEHRLGGRSRLTFLPIMDRHRRSNTHLTGYRSSRHNEMTSVVSCLTQLICLSSCVQEHTLTNKYLTRFNTLWGQQWHNKVCPIMTSHCNAYEVVTSRHMADVRAILCSER